MNSTLAALPAGVWHYDANDRLDTDTYDNNGNTVSSAGIQNQYDFENHLVQHGDVAIVYDGDGNRVSETVGGVTTNYLVDTQNPTGYAQVVEEIQNGAVARTLTWGLQLIAETQPINGTSATSYYGFDGRGSVRFLTDTTGAVTDTYDYDAFGNLVSSTGSTPNNYLFDGEQWDPALGLYYNRARYLDVRTGRFWVMDALEGNAQAPLSLHKYLYAAANPVENADPSGNDLIDATISSAVQTTLSTMSTLVLNSPLGNSVTSFVASQFIPQEVVQGLETATPDAIEVGAYGQVSANSRIPVGVTGFGGFEFLISPKTGRSALYGYYGAGLSFGSTASSGGVGGNVGLVFNSPTSAAYTENFVSLTIPLGALPPKVTSRIFEGVLRAPAVLVADDIPIGFGSMFIPVIGLVSTVTPSRWNKSITIFYSPSNPHVFGASLGLSTSSSIGAATNNVSLSWSYYWQLLPSGSVPFE